MKNLFLVLSLALLSALLLVPQQAAAVQPAPQEEGAGCYAIDLDLIPPAPGSTTWRISVTGAQGGYIIFAAFGTCSPGVSQFFGCPWDLGPTNPLQSPILFGDVIFSFNYDVSVSPDLCVQVGGVGETSNSAQIQ